jgi:nucleoid-associated protein YgaU
VERSRRPDTAAPDRDAVEAQHPAAGAEPAEPPGQLAAAIAAPKPAPPEPPQEPAGRQRLEPELQEGAAPSKVDQEKQSLAAKEADADTTAPQAKPPGAPAPEPPLSPAVAERGSNPATLANEAEAKPAAHEEDPPTDGELVIATAPPAAQRRGSEIANDPEVGKDGRGRSRTSIPERCQSAGAQVEVPGFYVVKQGDTLWAIAKRHYGAGARYRRIYEANRQSLKKGPDFILPCQQLYLPREKRRE